MSCLHEKVIVYPNNVWVEGDKVGVKDIETDGTLACQECHEELPLEDLHLWENKDISIGIPKDLADDAI